jgi:hypothetical protein
MFSYRFITHSGLTKNDLDIIIKIKSAAWPYSYEKQVKWININLKESDIHVLLYYDQELVAYLNLLGIKLIIDDVSKISYGVGCVCSKEKDKGWGSELITRTNSYIIQNNRVGLLFCKYPLVGFYKKNNWNLIEKGKLSISFNTDFINTMIFNCKEEFQNLKYLDKSF